MFTLLISYGAELRESVWIRVHLAHILLREPVRKFNAHFVTDIADEVFEDELHVALHVIQFVGYIKQYPTEAVSPPACLRRT